MIIKKNNIIRDFREIWKDKEMKYSMNEFISRYIFIFYEK